MVIERTIEVPVSRRVFLDLPPELPVGRARLELKVTPETCTDRGGERSAPDGWVNPLKGLAKAMGSKLTLEQFAEMQREDLELENENDRRLWGNK